MELPSINRTVFNFDDRVAQTLKNATVAELQKQAVSAVFSASQLRNKLNNTQTEYDFSNLTNRSSYLSSEKIVNITFLSTAYVNEFGQVQQTPELSLDICVIGSSINNNSVETALMNEAGTIKQIVNRSDWTIQISGVLVGSFINPTASNPLGGKPVDLIRDLNEISKSKISIEVASDYLNLLGVDRLLIKSLDIPQEINSINIQRFTLQCLSDSDDINIL